MSSYHDDKNAPATMLVYGTHIPHHWVEHIRANYADGTFDPTRRVIRERLFAHSTPAEQDAEAARRGMTMTTYRQHLIRELFPDLPEWNIPPTKPRRVLPKKSSVGGLPANYKLGDPINPPKTKVDAKSLLKKNEMIIHVGPKLKSQLEEYAAGHNNIAVETLVEKILTSAMNGGSWS